MLLDRSDLPQSLERLVDMLAELLERATSDRLEPGAGWVGSAVEGGSGSLHVGMVQPSYRIWDFNAER